MKEIYVYRLRFGDWKGLSKEEADEKFKGGQVFGAEMEVNHGDDDTIKVTVLKDRIGMFEVSDDEVNNLIKEYWAYVEEITGIVTTLE